MVSKEVQGEFLEYWKCSASCFTWSHLCIQLDHVCILRCVYYTLINKKELSKVLREKIAQFPQSVMRKRKTVRKDWSLSLPAQWFSPYLPPSESCSLFTNTASGLTHHHPNGTQPPTSMNFAVAEKYQLDCTIEILTQLFNFPEVRSELANTATLFLCRDSSVLPTH